MALPGACFPSRRLIQLQPQQFTFTHVNIGFTRRCTQQHHSALDQT